MTSGEYDTDKNRRRFIELGCDEETVGHLLEAEVQPHTVGEMAQWCGPFVKAALYHDLGYVDSALKEAGGNPDTAWENWAREEREAEEERNPAAAEEDDEDDEGEGVDYGEPTGPFVWGLWQGHWVVLSKAAAEQRANEPEREGDAWIDPRTIALDQVAQLEDGWGEEYGEEVDNMGGYPFLQLNDEAVRALTARIREDGHEVVRDDVLFQRMK